MENVIHSGKIDQTLHIECELPEGYDELVHSTSLQFITFSTFHAL